MFDRGARADRRDRRLRPLRASARARVVAGDHPQRVLQRRAGHRGHITHSGNRHARRLLIEAAWHSRHAPRRSSGGPEPSDRAWQAQVRLFHRYRHLTDQGKRPTVVNVAIARELAAFIWAEMTDQPPREQQTTHERTNSPPNPPNRKPDQLRPDLSWGPATGARARRTLDASMRFRLAPLVRGSQRPDTVLRSRPAYLRVTVVDSLTPAARPQHPPP